ncbi:MAG TPA: phosphatidylserine decarboxylase [Burkholderiaceae bacterium]
MTNRAPPWLAREGWPFIAAAVALAAVMAWLAGAAWSVPFWLLAAFVVQFFRDPPRQVRAGPSAIVSPADGRIVRIEAVRDPNTGSDALLISVFMNVFNVHSNRAPVDGVIERIEYRPGAFLQADLDKASERNEANAIVLRTTSGERISVVQVAGLIARRILCYVRPGDQVVRGERFGFIRFGSRVDLYLPRFVRPMVVVGDSVYAGTSVLAEF